MPLTNISCPGCGGTLHTDDLLEKKCVLNGCGADLRQALYDENGVIDFYRPEGIEPMNNE